MKTALEMAKTRLRLAVQEALDYGLGSAQIQAIAAEECVNEVDYAGLPPNEEDGPKEDGPEEEEPSAAD